MGTAGLVALPTMAAGTLAPGTLAPGVMSTSIAAQPIMTASTALLAGSATLIIMKYNYFGMMFSVIHVHTYDVMHVFCIAPCKSIDQFVAVFLMFMYWCLKLHL